MSGTTNISELPGSHGNIPNIQLHTKEINNKIPLSSINEMVSGLQKAASNNMTSLPSRDVPHDPERITQDPAVKPNYIPEAPNNNYIENEMDYDHMMRRNENEMYETDRLDTLYDELQIPIIVSIIFFLFQLPIFNKTLIKFIPSLFKTDGHPAFSGYMVKTLLFGVSIFIMNKGFAMLSEF
jgi:hypothetical protein|tara:strand:- start:617 stop:1162 length:546 start_codon:yes stop_codon:yes gene_type:complete